MESGNQFESNGPFSPGRSQIIHILYCLPPFYTIPIIPLLNRKTFHLLVYLSAALVAKEGVVHDSHSLLPILKCRSRAVETNNNTVG